MSLLSELKRRNVHRMAVLYAAAAWLVMQVVDVVEGKLPLPDWMGGAVLVVLAVGFPIALIISWFYEVTPEGITLDSDEEPAEATKGFAGRRVDFVIIAVLAAAVLVFAYDKWWMGPPPERSVAVLPFVNMSSDDEADWLGAGIADTALNMLVTIPDLHVASRTSSFQPRLQGMSIPEIAGLLGVATILEGSVQRQGDRLRVTAQLVNAADDNHLWSKNFDREYGDVFAVQDEIAEAVASVMQIVFLEDTKQRIDREGTDNLQAFEAYSKAMENLRTTTTDSVQLAVEQLQRAIELDPDFARAHAMLGHAYIEFHNFYWSGLDPDEIVSRARDEANEALRIAPGMSTALTLLADLTDDVDVQGQLYREAVENGPNDTLALRSYSSYLWALKYQFAEAEVLVQKAIRLDPLDERNYIVLSGAQGSNGQMNAALQTSRRGKEKIPDSVAIRDWESVLYFRLGDYRSAIAVEYETLELDPKEWWNRFDIAHFYLHAGMPDEAERWIESAAAHAPEGNFIHSLNPTLSDLYYQRNDQEVFTALKQIIVKGSLTPYHGAGLPLIEYGARLGKLDEVLETFEKLYPHLFAESSNDLDEDRRGLFITGLALLRNGDVQRGEPLMRVFLEGADKRERTTALRTRYYSSILGHLALGETDTALEKIRQLDAFDKWAHAGFVLQLMYRYSSLYDPIRDEPEFIELLDMWDKNAAEQRELLREMAQDLPVK